MLQTGDILFCRSNSWLNRTIRSVMRSNYGHVAFVIVRDGHVRIVDSQSNGTKEKCFIDWSERYNYHFIIGRNTKLAESINFDKELKKYVGKKYGKFDLLRHFIFIKLGFWIGIKREDKKLVCSEFVMRMYGNQEAYKMTPQDCFEWCLDNDFIFINR